MSLLHAIVLGIIQGLTEFIPVSSSGHLSIAPWLFGWEDFSGQKSLENAFDVALHLGTLVGALIYLRRDVIRYFEAGVKWLFGKNQLVGDARTALLLLTTTIPTAIIGLVVLIFTEDLGDRIWLVALCLGIFGIALWVADKRSSYRRCEDLSFKEAFLIGTVQGLAFQPGVSRAGAALTITRWLHLERVEAARFVFLMSLPVIAGAGLLKVGDLTVPSGWWPPFLVGTVAASVSGYLAVHWLLRFVSQGGFGIFMGYRLAIGISIFIILLTDWR